MSFPKYSEYKDSGVEWFPKTPSHWGLCQIKHVASIVMGQAPSSNDCNIEGDGMPFVQGCAEYGDTSPIPKQWCTNPCKIASKGDILISVRAPVGKLNIADQILAIGRGLCALQATDIHAGFLFWTINCHVGQLHAVSTGSTYEAVSVEDVRSILITLPSLPEQSAIAAFLDHETAKIDALVAEQEKLIELLKEKRQAVISHAVTKGLDPNVPMKDSGVEWLGKVPEHWGVHKLGYKCLLQGGYAFSSESFCSDGIPIVRMNNLSRGSLNLEEAVCIPADCSIDKVSLNNGDLIWGMSGSIGDTGSLGNFARVREKDIPCQLNQRVGRFLPKDSDVSIDFLAWIIQSKYFYEQILLLVTGTAQFNVSSNQVESCIVSLPPQDEQYEIVRHLAAEVERLDALQAEAQRAIDLLKERRAALISAAVTGKIDVRGLAEATQ